MESRFNADVEKLDEITTQDSDIEAIFLDYIASAHCDIKKICRLCLSVKIDEELISLHGEVACGRVIDLLTCFTSIELLPDKDLPSHVCAECTKQLVKCCEFKRRCEKSDASLKSVFRGEFVKDEPDEEEEVELTEQCESYNSLDTKEHFSYITVPDNASLINGKNTRHTKKVKGRKKKEYISAKENGVQCHLCSEQFPESTLLLEHIRSFHKEASAGYCVQCKEQFEEPRDLELHVSLHKPGPPWKCIQCFKEFVSRTALRRHVGRHMQRKRHRCERCGKAFSERSALQRHVRVHTGQPAERLHLCVECGKRFSDATRLRQHMASHSDLRPFACAACDKRFRSRRLLRSHARVHDAARPHRCRHCDKRFRHDSTCKAHERLHTGERPYVCAACGKTFLQSSNLRLHMRTHSGERPYACSECERRFKSSSTLKTHLRTHTGEKPYSCHICHKRFARAELAAHRRGHSAEHHRGHSAEHHRGHSAERPFACGACPRRCRTAARLRDHCAAVHDGEKPFECAVCSHRVATKSHLLKHIRSHQNRKPTAGPQKRKLVVVRVTDDTPYASIPENHPIILSNNDSCGEVIISNDCTDITNIAANDMSVSLTNAMPLQVFQTTEENSMNFNQCETVNNLNLLTVSEATSSMEVASVKLYQLDQSLVQIHSSGGQVTISKITSKMTANFE